MKRAGSDEEEQDALVAAFLDVAQHSEAGQLLRQALDLRAAIKVGIVVGLDEIAADEFYAMLAVEELPEQYERERTGKS